MSAKLSGMALWRIDAAALLIALGAGAGVYVLAVAPAMRARTEERAKQATLAPQEALRDQLTLSLQQTKDRLALVLKELDGNPLRLEPVSQINYRLMKVTELAAETGLNLEQVTPGNQSQADDAVVMAIGLTGRGPFPAAAAFLARLHAEFTDMTVTRFRLSGNTEATDAQGAFEFDLAWYAAPDAVPMEREAGVGLP